MFKVFPSVQYLSSLFSGARAVSQKGCKFLTICLQLAQSFLSTVFLLSRTWKTSNSHLKDFFSKHIKTKYTNKILYFLSFFSDNFEFGIRICIEYQLSTKCHERFYVWYVKVKILNREVGSNKAHWSLVASNITSVQWNVLLMTFCAVCFFWFSTKRL
jgi:hypothetical protein